MVYSRGAGVFASIETGGRVVERDDEE